MPCATMRRNDTDNWFFNAQYEIIFEYRPDRGFSEPHDCTEVLRGVLWHYGATWNCEFIRPISYTVIYNRNFMRILELNEIFRTPNALPVNSIVSIGVDLAEISGITTDQDMINTACPYYRNMPEQLARQYACTRELEYSFDGYSLAMYWLTNILQEDCPPFADGVYWIFVDDTTPLQLRPLCNSYWFAWYWSSGGLSSTVTGTWVFQNDRLVNQHPHFAHVAPVMYVAECSIMGTQEPANNTKEDYEVLKGLTLGTSAWETDLAVDLLRKMKLMR